MLAQPYNVYTAPNPTPDSEWLIKHLHTIDSLCKILTEKDFKSNTSSYITHTHPF